MVTQINDKFVSAIFLNQSDIGIENSVYPETQINLYGDNKALFTLGALFNLVQKETNLVIYLVGSSDKDFDFVFFHGTSNPLSFKDLFEIKRQASKLKKPKKYCLEINAEMAIDRLNESWKLNDLYSIRSEGQLISMSCNLLGLRLAKVICKSLIETGEGHTHFDGFSTKRSLELILRNKETDWMFQ
ncbi:hypothetical protein [Gorillibacterium massiliense]|uniref:hypothetical protein n=1 Tax=Gorillibacterium massiliense TaxID=1280390 RepID=UPI0005938F36|nr:hypothetical protein [Gorillibacterium massiliense]